MNPRSSNKVPATRIAYAVSVALTGNYAPAVLAQSQSVDLEAVIVTARKREETLLDIPQEIQTISQQQLERANLDSIKEFSRFVPSLSYTATVTGRGTKPSGRNSSVCRRCAAIRFPLPSTGE